MYFEVTWGAADGGSGLSHYDVQYRVGPMDAWQGWLTNTLETYAPFLGTVDQTYYFKVTATDKVNNTDSEESEAVTVKGVTKYYSLGSQRVAMRQGDVVYYLHGDHLGSTSLTTDQTGNKFSEARYLPYGQERWTSGATPTDFTFTGQRAEAGFGLMDYNARFYSPYLGRFISPDTVVPKVENPQHWNRYSYVYNNPIRLVDPTGHTGCTDGGPSESDVDGGTIPNCSGSNTGGGSHDSHGDGGGGGAGIRTVGQGTGGASPSSGNVTGTGGATARPSISNRPAGSTGTGAYDAANGRGVYVLSKDGKVRYVGQGDAPARLRDHAADLEKGGLKGDIIANNNLTKAEARGLEQALMKHYGGPKSSPTYTGQLLNKNNGINPARVDANAVSYREAGKELFEEALEIIKKLGLIP